MFKDQLHQQQGKEQLNAKVAVNSAVIMYRGNMTTPAGVLAIQPKRLYQYLLLWPSWGLVCI